MAERPQTGQSLAAAASLQLADFAIRQPMLQSVAGVWVTYAWVHELTNAFARLAARMTGLRERSVLGSRIG